jgi:PAS domain S-box-containing protein
VRPNSTAEETVGSHAPMDFLTGGGEMGERVRNFDWSSTPLGPVEDWPQSLRSAVSILLPSKAQIVLYWGKEWIGIYNDAYRPVLGSKHPWALGRSALECWQEVRQVIEPLFEGVMRTGEAYWAKDYLFYLERHGFPEETYFDISYDPVRDESGRVGGVFCIVSEMTGRVLGERRLRTLRELDLNTSGSSDEEICLHAAAILAQNAADVPFSMFLLLDRAKETARLAASSGNAPPLVSGNISLTNSDDPSGLCIAQVLKTGKAREASPALFVNQVPPSASTERLLIMPLLAAEQPIGVLVAGVSRHLALAGHYRDFFDLVSSRLSSAIANRRAYDEERKRAQQLAELDRAKTAFFSNVSHEFRTPLTLMLGPLEDTLALTDGISAQARQGLELAHRNSLRLLKLVNTLLDFSRIEAGRIDACFEPTDLATYTAELASTFRSAMDKAKLRYVVDCPPLAEPVYVDREMWEKIVFNLLSNALKFTFNGEITVELRCRGKWVEMTVSDTGEGIPLAELPRVFERFHRVRATRSRSHEGTGIGLALVRELVRLHGGEVRVESVEGRGTKFIVAIPTGSTHLPKERIETARTRANTSTGAPAFLEEALRWLPDTPHTAGLSLKGDDAAEAANSCGSAELERTRSLALKDWIKGRPRILLADDNSDMRGYLRRLLVDHGFEVSAVADGEAALALARAEPPDLVVSDVMMPRLDGFGLLRALRDDPETRSIPIILLSARAGEAETVVGIEAGADDYIIKPFGARELVARVGTQIQLARVRREAAKVQTELRAEAQTARDQLETVLAGISDLFAILDQEWRYVFFNDRLTQVTGKCREELMGQSIWEAFPKVVGTNFEKELRRCVAEQIPAHFEHRYPPLDRWFENHCYPRADGVTIFSSDITERKQAEMALTQSEFRWRTMAEALPNLVWTDLPDGQCDWLSSQWGRYTGIPERQLLGLNWLEEVIHPDDRERTLACWQAACQDRGQYDLEYRIRRHDGQYRWFKTRGVPIRDQAGKITYWFGTCTDIQDLKEAEERERTLIERTLTATAKFEAVFNQSGIFAGITDLEGHLQEVNNLALEACGYTREQVLNRPFWETPWWRGSDEVKAQIRAAVTQAAAGKVFRQILRYWLAEGTERIVDFRMHPIRDQSDTVRFLHPTGIDITDQRLIEERFRLAALSDAITLFEQDSELRYAWLYPLHPEHAQALGKTDLELLPNECGQALAQWKREVMATGQPQRREVSTSLSVGARAYDVIILPRRNSIGQIVGVAGTALDITARKEVERTLRESEERFRSMLDNSPMFIFIKDTEGRYLQVNRFYEELLHLAEPEILGKTDSEIFPESIAREFRENDLTVLRTGKPLTVEEIAPHRDSLHTYISVKFPLRRDDGSIYAIMGISTDITERKENEIAAQRLAAIIESSDDAIISMDLDGIISSWNKGAERLFGYSPEEVIGDAVTILMPLERVDEKPAILERIRRGERVDHYETVRRHKNGSLLDISLTVSPITDSSGKVIGASKVARDITDKVRAKEKLEQTVAERTASLREAIAQMEEFSYTVSHDLRAPLRGMQVYSQALLEDFSTSLPSEAAGYLQRIYSNAVRLDRMVSDLLAYGRVVRAEVRLEPIDASRLIRHIVEQYPNLQDADADIDLQPLHEVMAHEPSLTQALSNLLSNSVKFVPPDVKPKISIWSERQNTWVRIWVRDNGIGVDPRYQHKLFNMFERLHPHLEYDGTGVGLAIVRKAVERMGGKVGMESDGISGSRFWIELKAKADADE